MTHALTLSPRYRLDDELPWLEGIDPVRHYWIAVNGDAETIIPIPGLVISSLAQLKETIQKFRALQNGEEMTFSRVASNCVIYCIGENCYAIEGTVQGALVWHLFDQETLESLMMTAHPHWQCAPQDLELVRRLLNLAWQQTVVA